MKKMKKNLLTFGLLALSVVFLFNACASRNDLAKLSKFPDGFYLEHFVPEEAWLVISSSPTSELQNNLSQKHSLKILGEKEQELLDFVLNPFLRNPLRDMVKTMLSRGGPMIFSVSPGKNETSDYLLSFAFEDRAALENILAANTVETLFEPPVHVTRDGDAINFEQLQPQLYGRYNGKFFHIGSNSTFAPFLKKDLSHQQSLLDNKRFRSALKKMTTERVGYWYFVPSEIPKKFTAFSKNTSLFTDPKVFSADDISLTNIVAEDDGIRATTWTNLPKNIDPKLQNLFKSSRVQLDKKTPSRDVVFYSEEHHLGDILKMYIEETKKTLSPASQENFVKNLEQQIGLSLERDVYPLFNKNFAVTLEDQGKILPVVSMWIDVGNQTEGAQKLLKQLDTGLSTFATLFNVSSEAQEPFIERKKTETPQGEIFKLTFTPSKFPQDKLPVPLFQYVKDETWDLNYGLMNNGLLFVSTRSEMPDGTVADDVLYQALEEKIKGFDKTERAFIATEPLRKYLDRILELGRESNSLSPGELSTIENVKKFIENIPAAITGNREHRGWVESQTFVKIK